MILKKGDYIVIDGCYIRDIIDYEKLCNDTYAAKDNSLSDTQLDIDERLVACWYARNGVGDVNGIVLHHKDGTIEVPAYCDAGGHLIIRLEDLTDREIDYIDSREFCEHKNHSWRCRFSLDRDTDIYKVTAM